LQQSTKNNNESDYLDTDKIPKEELTTGKSKKFQFKIWKSQDDARMSKNRSHSVSDVDQNSSSSKRKFLTMRFGSKKNK